MRTEKQTIYRYWLSHISVNERKKDVQSIGAFRIIGMKKKEMKKIGAIHKFSALPNYLFDSRYDPKLIQST